MGAGLTRREALIRGGGLAAALVAGPALLLEERAEAAADPRLRALDRALRGPLLLPGSAAYEAARQPYNARFAGVRPLAVARPLDAKDVRQIVLWSRQTGVRIAARSGGHSYGGYSTTRGVIVDLSKMSRVTVTADGRAVVGSGARLFDVYSTLARSGLAIPTGTCPTVGIGGLALGGGFGLASRAWGLTCDNLVELEIVTADGKVLTCDRRRNPDLFWACRGGGGGNFGVVTRFVFRTHRVSSGSYFVATWPWENVEEVVDSFQRWAPHTADALGPICRLATGSANPTVQVFGQMLGPEAALRRAVEGLTRHLPVPRLQAAGATWLDLQLRWSGCLGESADSCRAFEPVSFAGASAYATAPIRAQGLAVLRSSVERRQGASGAVLLDAYGGAINRVAPSATAFVHRRALFSCQYFSAGGTDAREWVHETDVALRPFVSQAAYQNYIDPELRGWQRAYYGTNLERLVAVKRRYDADNLFRFAQSVPLRV